MFFKKLKVSLNILIFQGIIISMCGCSSTPTEQPTVSMEETETVATSEPILEVSEAKPTVTYQVSTNTSSLDETYQISNTLFGLFLEDINHAVDGGMYAELIKNRSFEYGKAAANSNKHGWTASNSEAFTFDIIDGSEDDSYLNANNPHYAILSNTAESYDGIYTKGYLDGLALTSDTDYHFSIFLKSADNNARVQVSIRDDKDNIYASSLITDAPITSEWTKYELTLTPTLPNGLTDDDGILDENMRFYVEVSGGSVCTDMISLMPVDTYKGTNIRKDIGEALEALSPTFLRFPGGCVIEGRDLESMYSWKDSIGNGMEFVINDATTVGDVAVRPQGRSIWNGSQAHPYYTTYGLGFYEYFELCEILDCLPIPVLNAGMTCQIQSPKYIIFDINSEEFKQCIQDALDLVEFCKGDTNTYWGSVRAAMGHEEPFDLKYIAIGNEQWQSEYYQHFGKFEEAFALAAQENPKLYGDIKLIVANGPSSGDSAGWDYIEIKADEMTTLVDEHYYEQPSFFFTNTERYNSYDRTLNAKVFLGEYAAQSNTLEAALSEAAYMTGLEKNGDVVELACYAPLFGNSKQNQWSPDLIWYGNDMVYGSVNYYVQQLFSSNAGATELPTILTQDALADTSTLSGKIGLGTWQTSAAYDNLIVTDNKTGETLYSCTFDNESVLKNDGYELHEGEWSVQDGRLIQEYTGAPFDANTGDAVYVGDSSWTNYTMTVDAEILSGAEGFLIPVCVENTANNIFWNIGGWGNTVSCLQIVSGNSKSGQVTGTVKNLKLKHNEIYQLKIVVNGNNIQCFINDSKYVDYTAQTPDAIYESAVVAENGDIILKMINTTENTISIDTTLKEFDASAYQADASISVLAGEALSDVNSFDAPEKIIPVSSTLAIEEHFIYEAPAYSLSVIRIPKK